MSRAAFRTGPIRYATAARFGRPVPTDPTAASDASASIAPQLPGALAPIMGAPGKVPQDEDCLLLSIATPGFDDAERPVMVFFHGGAFATGGGVLDWYDGTSLAAENDVVVVSVNYRLGALGFLRREDVSEGNLGVLDQIEALRWVSDNIARHGGDPACVTLVGQSAGAISVRLVLEVPEIKGLFCRAILQSGLVPDIDRSADYADEVGRLFSTLLDDDPLLASTDRILDAQRTTVVELVRRGGARPPVFHPTSGVAPLPELGSHFDENVRDLQVLCGWNLDDGSAFTHTGVGPQTAEYTLATFAEPVLAFVKELAAAGADATVYRFDWRPEGSPYGATHCVELPLLLGSREAWEGAPMLGTVPWDRVESLGRAFRAVWAGFARTGTVDRSLAREIPIVIGP